jgi:hypothetical protein
MDLRVARRSQDHEQQLQDSTGPKFSFSVASLLATRVLQHHQQQQQQQLLSSKQQQQQQESGQDCVKEEEEEEEEEEGSDISVGDEDVDEDGDDKDPLQRRLHDDAEQHGQQPNKSRSVGGGDSKMRVAMPTPLLPLLPPHLLPPGWPPLLPPPPLSSLNHSLFKSGMEKIKNKIHNNVKP